MLLPVAAMPPITSIANGSSPSHARRLVGWERSHNLCMLLFFLCIACPCLATPSSAEPSPHLRSSPDTALLSGVPLAAAASVALLAALAALLSLVVGNARRSGPPAPRSSLLTPSPRQSRVLQIGALGSAAGARSSGVPGTLLGARLQDDVRRQPHTSRPSVRLRSQAIAFEEPASGTSPPEHPPRASTCSSCCCCCRAEPEDASIRMKRAGSKFQFASPRGSLRPAVATTRGTPEVSHAGLEMGVLSGAPPGRPQHASDELPSGPPQTQLHELEDRAGDGGHESGGSTCSVQSWGGRSHDSDDQSDGSPQQGSKEPHRASSSASSDACHSTCKRDEEGQALVCSAGVTDAAVEITGTPPEHPSKRSHSVLVQAPGARGRSGGGRAGQASRPLSAVLPRGGVRQDRHAPLPPTLPEDRVSGRRTPPSRRQQAEVPASGWGGVSPAQREQFRAKPTLPGEQLAASYFAEVVVGAPTNPADPGAAGEQAGQDAPRKRYASVIRVGQASFL